MPTEMFFDMETEVLRTRIRKFRDPQANDNFKLEQAVVLVDLVDRMLNASKYLVNEEMNTTDTVADPVDEGWGDEDDEDEEEEWDLEVELEDDEDDTNENDDSTDRNI